MIWNHGVRHVTVCSGASAESDTASPRLQAGHGLAAGGRAFSSPLVSRRRRSSSARTCSCVCGLVTLTNFCIPSTLLGIWSRRRGTAAPTQAPRYDLRGEEMEAIRKAIETASGSSPSIRRWPSGRTLRRRPRADEGLRLRVDGPTAPSLRICRTGWRWRVGADPGWLMRGRAGGVRCHDCGDGGRPRRRRAQ